MKEFIVAENDANLRVDKFVIKVCPSLPKSLLNKYIRLKRVKINDKRCTNDQRLSLGDNVKLYINDELFAGKEEDNAFLNIKPDIEIAYEDENILIADKRVGLIVHSDDKESYNTLISHIKAYLYNKGEYDPENENTFVPALCNRIDRNTSGLVIAAKNAVALREMNDIIKHRKIEKRYLAVVLGTPSPKKGTINAFLTRDEKEKKVYVSDHKQVGAKDISTKYEVVSSNGKTSLVDIELLTGRTHQIRASFAHIGNPLYGDGKYAVTSRDKDAPKHHQLCAYKLIFTLNDYVGALSYLKGKTIISSLRRNLDKFM